ncbi:MAG TPA: DUF4124 domain-containing protein [Syntrophales bacterium]|nr:DUF4124 domain-containing protein [Syntrophales bacterium]
MTKPSTKWLLIALVAAWVGMLLAVVDSPAQLYRYVDKSGNVVVTDNPPPGVKAEAIEQQMEVLPPSKGEESLKDRPPQAPGVKPAPPSSGGDSVKEDAEKAAKQEADRVIEQRMADEAARKQAERQLRLEEADRLEQEARKPVQPTQENIDRQLKLMQDAQRLRDMP